jgi:hypothetical protein
MGASGWDYHAAYTDDPQQMLASLHRSVLAERSYYWANEDVPRPTTLAQLHKLYEDEDNEDLASEGTHSILDIYRVLPAGSPDEFGAIMPLTAEELQTAFGTSAPTRAQFDAVYDGGMSLIVDFPRWSGRYTTLHDDGQPTEIAVWGFSGD